MCVNRFINKLTFCERVVNISSALLKKGVINTSTAKEEEEYYIYILFSSLEDMHLV